MHASADSESIDRSRYQSVSRFCKDLRDNHGREFLPDLANEGEEITAIASLAIVSP